MESIEITQLRLTVEKLQEDNALLLDEIFSLQAHTSCHCHNGVDKQVAVA